MKKTENYGLTLYEKEDKMNITAEENSLNANMKIIDKTLKEKANAVDIPTKVGELENDIGYLNSIPSDYKTKRENDELYQEKGNYLKEETDPTVPNFVKNIKETDISNWNNKSEFSGNYNDLTNKPTIPTVPTNISAFNNDKGYLTSVPSEYVTETELNGKNYATKSELHSHSNKTVLDNTTASYTTAEKTKLAGLSNYDDTELKNLINSKATIQDMTNYIEEHKEELNGKDGYSPIKGTDYWTEEDKEEIKEYVKNEVPTPTKTSELINDSGFLTEIELTEEQLNEIADVVVDKAEFSPIYAGTVDKMTDTSKLYLGSNGNIWAYTEKLTENKVNQYVDDKAKYDVRLHPSYVGTENEPWRVCKGLVYVEIDGIDLTNKTSYIIRFSGVTVARHSAMGITGQVVFLDQSSSTQWDLTGYTSATYTDSTGKFVFKQDDNGYYIDLMDANPSADTKRIFFGICVADNTSVSSTDCENLFVECVPFTTYTPEYNWNDTGITYANYAMTDADTTAIADKLYNYKVVYVDGDAGNDANTGSQNSPLKTIQNAINSGAKTIYCKPGKYNEAITLNNIHGVKIISGWEEYVSGSRPKVRIDHSETLEPIDNGNGLKTLNLPADTYKNKYPLLYNVFVTKQYAPTSGSGVNIAYTVSLWNEGDGLVSSHYKLVPVMTLEECQSTTETFFYDGTTLYINSTGSIFKMVGTSRKNLMNDCSDITFEDIAFDYTYYDTFNIKNSNDIVFRNCEFSHSSYANGIATEYMNGELYNCEAYHNRNDGFNFHYFGETTVYNCIGAYNYDDGISHHDGCTGSIHGGQYHHNGKGGVSSPTYGAVIDIYNVVMNDNKYGIYAYGGTANREIIVNGCYIHHNTYGVGTQYDLLVINSVIKDNTTNTSTKDNATITVVPTI